MKPNTRKQKLERIMFEKKISLDELHDGTKLANPSLLHITKGRKIAITEFRERTLIDLEKFVGVPPKDFLGWEGGNLSQEDFKSPKDEFRVIGIDLLNSEDWFQDFKTEKKAIKYADEKKGEMLKTYIYDDKGKRVDKIVDENADENVEEVETKKEA